MAARAHIPDTEELVFDGLHQGLRQVVETGYLTLFQQWTEQGHPEALERFGERLETAIAAYLAACEVVNELAPAKTDK
jgi:hypothetical protein